MTRTARFFKGIIMKVKIELEPNETIEESEELLEKALSNKLNHSDEKYLDQAFNDFYDYIIKLHANLIEQITNELKDELKK